jgi:hypothetical protein
MYYIYHIPGIKIGCTKNLKRRIYQQYKGDDWELLETHTDIDIASERELVLQKQYGYKVDTLPYKRSREIASNKQSYAGKVSATKQWKENRERELEKCKMGGQATRKIQSKKTYMCDLDGNILKEFVNRKDAARFVNGFAPPLTNSLNKLNKTYKGYRWIG